MNSELDQDTVDLVLNLAEVAGDRVGHRFEGYVEPGDMRQEAALWALENPRKVADLLTLDENNGDAAGEAQHRRNLLLRYMCNAAERQAREAKAHMCGYRPEDECFYTPGMLGQLLPWYFHAVGDPRGPQYQEGGSSATESFESDTERAMAADLGAALGRLAQRQCDALWVFYTSAEDEQRSAAEAHGLDPKNVARDAGRAVNKMSAVLGGRNPWRDREEADTGQDRPPTLAEYRAAPDADRPGTVANMPSPENGENDMR